MPGMKRSVLRAQKDKHSSYLEGVSQGFLPWGTIDTHQRVLGQLWEGLYTTGKYMQKFYAWSFF